MERYFFHADTNGYTARLKKILLVVIAPIITLCIFCSVTIVLNFSSDFARIMMWIIAFSVFTGMVFTFAAVYLTDKHKRRNSRYTFFDILPDGMIYSEYAGEFTHFGKRVILRRLYYIPFKTLKAVKRSPKTAPHRITFEGEIREYFHETDRLGYHITEDGDLVFDTFALNTYHFNKIESLTIKERLGSTRRLERSVLAYWEEFRKIPERKPFDITKAIAVKKRKKLKTSNALLETPNYSRNWK